MLSTSWRRVAHNARSILTYLLVAICLFAYFRYREWRNWETAANEWFLIDPPSPNAPRDLSPDAGAPLSQWWVEQTYPSELDCEKNLAKRGANLAAEERCIAALRFPGERPNQWWSAMPADLEARRHPSRVISNLLRNFIGDLFNVARNLYRGPGDAFLVFLAFLYAAYLLWRGLAAWISAMQKGDYGQLQQCALVSGAVAVIAFFASVDLDTPQRWVDWPWSWGIAFGAFYLVYQHTKREEKRARRGSWKEFLRGILLDALEGIWCLGSVVLPLALFTTLFDLGDLFSGKIKVQSLFSSIVFLIAGISLLWIAHKKLGFPRVQGEQIEAGSQAWVKESPARMMVARSLGLPEPPWSEEEVSRLQGRLNEIHTEWDAKVRDRMSRDLGDK
jgi:hypothetical protein